MSFGREVHDSLPSRLATVALQPLGSGARVAGVAQELELLALAQPRSDDHSLLVPEVAVALGSLNLAHRTSRWFTGAVCRRSGRATRNILPLRRLTGAY